MPTPEIVPFWQRLRPIASYPFRGAALYSMLALTAFMTFGSFVPVLGWLLVGVAWLAAFKYAFEVLQTTADGRMASPEVVLGIDNAVVWRYILLQLLTLLVPAAIAVFAGWPLALAVFAVIVLAQPAAIMVLALTHRLRSALNPSLWASVIGRIGWPYLALVGLLLVMQVSAGNAGGLLSEVLPALLAEPLVRLFSLWALFATFHLMGYLLWQYHESLGLQPAAISNPVMRPFDRDRELLEQASEAVQRGEPAVALQLVREDLRARAVSIEVHELYRRLLQQAGDSGALAGHGPLFLHLLMLEKQERKALGLARECLDADPDFVALEPEDSAKLAERARFAGQNALALDLLLAAVRRHPRHPDMPQWTLRAVELLLRKAGAETQARTLLEAARAQCRDDALGERLAAQLAELPA